MTTRVIDPHCFATRLSAARSRVSGALGILPGILAALVVLGAGCDPKVDASEEAGAGADATPESGTQSSSAPKMSGYDLRLLRPGEAKLAEQFEQVRSSALGEDKRVAVLFSADWCAPCKRLEAELGNMQPAEQIDDVRIVMVKEEDWRDATRMTEFDNLRLRWSPAVGAFPLFVMLDEHGEKQEEMKAAIERLEQAGLEPTIANWFSHAPSASAG